MLDKGVELEERDVGREPLSAAELEELIGERDYRPFLNPRNELYRERAMAEKPPSRSEAIKLMADHPNLIRRPILIKGKRMVIGWNQAAAERMM